MYRRILVPLDGSDLAAAVLPHATELARILDAELILLQAVPSLAQLAAQMTSGYTGATGLPPVANPYNLAAETHGAQTRAARDYLSATAKLLESDGPRVRWETVEEGSPAQAILSRAENGQADLIAMSTHGRGGLGRLILGSVADEVLRNSTIPILLMRPAPE